jgi:type I restriction enzyme S subunit
VSDWPVHSLGEVCEIIAGQSPPGSSYNAEGLGVPFYQGKKEFGPKEIGPPASWTTAPTKIAEAGDILISVRAPVGPVNFLSARACIGRGLAAIRASERVDRDFLFYNLLMREPEIAGKEGAVFASINRSEIAALEFPLPPAGEQRRIVAVLDEAFAAIGTATANAEKNLANARELPSNLIEAVLSAEADQQAITLAEAADPTCTLSYGIVQPGDEFDGGLPVVRPVDLQQEVVELDGVKRIDPKIAAAYQRTTLRGDEILLCVRGTTGTLSLASPELVGGNVTRGIVPIRFNPAVVSRAFGYYLMRSAAVQKQIRAATYGTALMQINIGDLKKLVLRIPSLTTQAALSESLDLLGAEIATLEEDYSQKIAALSQLKKSLLHRAFSGELTEREPLAA